MRKKRWIAPVWGMLAAAAFGQTASAQAPGSPLDGPFPPAGPPAGPPVAPPPTAYPAHPTYTPIAPDAASPAGYPPQMEAWPTISPYDHAVDTTYNDRGIWFREMLNQKRNYKVDVEFISARFRQPGNVTVGAHAVIDVFGRNDEFFQDLEVFKERPGLELDDIFTVKDAFVVDAQGRYFDGDQDGTLGDIEAQIGNLPRPVTGAIQFTSDGAAFTNDIIFADGKGGLLQIVNLSDDPNEDITDSDSNVDDEIADTFLYPVTGQVFGDDAVTLFGGTPDVVGEKRENPASPGLRIVFGVEDEDESGFDWTGYWVNAQPTVFRRGLDDPDRPRLTNIVFFDAPWIAPGAAEVLDYNVLFQLSHESETAGTDLALYHTPMVDFGWFRMRPLYGARYDYIREQFNFTGKDNGMAFVYDADGDIFDQTGGGSVLGSSVVPNTVEEIDGQFFLEVLNPYQTTVTSKVRSHLYGPQIGFDMQAGGEHLMLTAVTKAGVLANTEKLTLDAEGFGSTEARTGIRPVYSDAKTHTHVSPFLEFKTTADINVFPIIPYVNQWNWLKGARVRAGWTTLVVGNLSRPMDNVVWRSDGSGGPYIKDRSRDHWYMQYWDVGIHWNF